VHVAQADHAAAFDGGQIMRFRLAGNSGALAAARSEGYGDCAGRINVPPPHTRRVGRPGTRRGVLHLTWLVATILLASVTAAHAEPLRIAMLGDSLTAGYGLPPEQALPARLEAALTAAGRTVTVANHGVSGDTSAGGVSRVDWMMGDKPVLVIVALGANDALRGLAPEETEKNIDAIIAKVRGAGAAVLLCGMKAPRNYGPEYTAKFDSLYERLAARHGVALMPFLLEGVAMMPALNQADGIHPNVKGVDIIVANLVPAVTRVLDAMKKPNG
jgi:acyl-CoA thioesterase-1